MKIRDLVAAVLGVFLLLASARAQTYTQVDWQLWDWEFKPHDIVNIKSLPDSNNDCVTRYISEPQYDANVELAVDVSSTSGGGLVMAGWAVQSNDDYSGASLTLTAAEEFVATAGGTLPADLALKINMKVNARAFVAEKSSDVGDPFANWLRFHVLIRNLATNETVALWTNPATGIPPMLSLASDLDLHLNPFYWMARDDIPTPCTIELHDNGCGVDICPDWDLDVIDYRVPFNGAYVNVSESPSLIVPDLKPGERHLLTIRVGDSISGMGALDLWNTVEFGETPFVFGTLSGETFTPLSPEDQAKLTLDSSTGAMRHPNVAVDVKPGDWLSAINTASEGVTTVAILGSDYLDVMQIDPASIRLEGKHCLRWSIEDVASPSDDAFAAEVWDLGGPDGVDDLVVKFDTQEIAEALAAIEDGAHTRLWLTGNLHEEYGGQLIQGYDTVLVHKR